MTNFKNFQDTRLSLGPLTLLVGTNASGKSNLRDAFRFLHGISDLPKEWAWQEIRAHRDPKEAYFAPFAKSRGVLNEPGAGRKTLAMEAASRYARIRAHCPEDVAALEDRIRAALTET